MCKLLHCVQARLGSPAVKTNLGNPCRSKIPWERTNGCRSFILANEVLFPRSHAMSVKSGQAARGGTHGMVPIMELVLIGWSNGEIRRAQLTLQLKMKML